MDEAEDEFEWPLYDAHCHPTDTMSSIEQIPTMNVSALTIMATRAQDQDLVANVAKSHALSNSSVSPSKNNDNTYDDNKDDTANDGNDDANWRKIVPSFGWHPWFSHHLYDDTDRSNSNPLTPSETKAHYHAVLTPSPSLDSPEDENFLSALPPPKLLSQFLTETRERLTQFPSALIGEIGLDRAFRLPVAWNPNDVENRDGKLTPGGREGRRLSSFRVELEHQKRVFLSQVKLAAEMGRAVSVHGVQCHGVLFETLRETWRGSEIE
ncbi:MAG: hypothetical protein Q9159_003625, partial [Coniocarpon cinnabarinum]